MSVVWGAEGAQECQVLLKLGQVAPLAKACWTWRAFLSSGRTAITSATLNMPANAARLTRERVVESLVATSCTPRRRIARASSNCNCGCT